MISVLLAFYPGDYVVWLVIRVIIEIAVVVCVASLLSYALLRHRAAMRHSMWLSCLAYVLVSPVVVYTSDRAGLSSFTIPIGLPDFTKPAQRNLADLPESGSAPNDLAPELDGAIETQRNSRVRPVPLGAPIQVASLGREPRSQQTPPAPMPTPKGLQSTARSPFDALRVLVGAAAAAWMLGVVILFVRFVRGWRLMTVLQRNASAIGGNQFDEILERVREILHVQWLPPVMTSADVSVPIVVGFRSTVILPEDLPASIAPGRLCDVLVHECAHVVRGDQWVGLLQRLAEALFWPHPSIHCLNRHLARAREETCDNHVLRRNDATRYAETLLQISERSSAAIETARALALLSPRWGLEDRVAGLLDERRSVMTRTSLWWIGIIATVLFAVSSVIAGVRSSKGPEPAHRLAGITLTETAVPAPKPTPAEAEPEGEETSTRMMVSGVVVDEQGNPAPGVLVRVLHFLPNAASTRTGSDGTFELNVPLASIQYSVLLAATHDGSRQGLLEFRESHNPERPARIVLKSSREVAVQVTDAAGEPVADAAVDVIASYRPIASGTTNSRGTVSFRIPEDAKVDWVIALKPGAGFDYYENYKAFPTVERPAPPRELKLVLDGARSVQVQTIDSSGTPVRGVRVTPWTIQKKGKLSHVNLSGSNIAASDDSGMTRFDWLPASLEQGITFLTHHADYHCPEPPVLKGWDDSTELTATQFHNAQVRGKVTLPDGKPASGVLLQAEGRGATNHYFRGHARTTADGSYQLKVYPNQSYIFAIVDDTWAAPSHVGILLKEKEERKDLNFALVKGTLVHGTVTVGADREPSIGHTATLIQLGGSTPERSEQFGRRSAELVRWSNTDQTGHYSFRVGPGQYRLRLTDSEEPVMLSVREQEEVVYDAHAARTARGNLVGTIVSKASDEPVAGAIVNGESIGAGGHAGFRTVTGKNGSFETERWRDEMIVYARSADGELAGYVIISADEQRLNLKLAPAAKVVGRVYDTEGKPVSNQRVTCIVGAPVEGCDRINIQSVTDEMGRYTISGLAVNCRGQISVLQGSEWISGPSITVQKAGETEVRDVVITRSN